jgi:hypothetical protein
VRVNRKWFEQMGAERVRLDLLRGFNLSKGNLREEALDDDTPPPLHSFRRPG